MTSVAPLALAAEQRTHDRLPDPSVLRRQSEALEAEGAEKIVRQVYEKYAEATLQSGNPVYFTLSDFETIPAARYSRYRWLDLMSPSTGWRIRQYRQYFDPSWLGDGVAVYEVRWQKKDPEKERWSLQILSEAEGKTIAEILERLIRERLLKEFPFAITTYRVRATLGDRSRLYRAAAFWTSADASRHFDFNIQDRIAPEVVSVVGDPARIVDPRELERLQKRPAPRENVNGRALAPSVSESCIAETASLDYPSTYNANSQGHTAGVHEAVFAMRARCVYDSGCSVSCQPTITHQGCYETTGSRYPGICEHESDYTARVSPAGGYRAEAACGAALACGIKECCFGLCGGVSLSFSGSGGGFTATASNTGGGRTYDLSIDIHHTCAAPRTESPCGSTAASTVDGRATAALFIPCDDGGSTDPGPDEPSPSDGGAQGDGTPILLDLGGSGFELTDLAGGVAFDLDADGTPEPISWTAAGSDDAFLVLDRDGDGAIDDGSELFGDATPQPPSAEPHGYRALAVFDGADAGGDGDGRITAADAVFADLELWRDADHDGVADAGERQSLAAAGVVALELDYVESRRRDRHGNLVRYTSRFEVEAPHGRPHKTAADVIFLHAQP